MHAVSCDIVQKKCDNDIYTIFWKWYDIRYHDISSNDMLITDLDWPCGPHKFFWSSLTANQLITTCASLHTAASSHCQLFYSETGQYGRIVHLEEYRQPSPPVRDGLPILLPRASSQGSTQPLFLLVVPAAKGIRKDWQEGNSLVPTVLLCPLHLVAKHIV